MFDIDDFPVYRDQILVKRFEDFLFINPEGQDAWVDITDPINWVTYDNVYWTGTVWRQTSFGNDPELVCGNESLKNFFPYSYRFTLNTGTCIYLNLYPETGDPILTLYSSGQEIVTFPDPTKVFKTEYGYGKRISFVLFYPIYSLPDLLEISKIEYRRIPFTQDSDWTQVYNIDIASLGFSGFAQFFIMDDSLFLIGCGNTAESQYDLYFASFENGSWTNVKIVDTVDEYYPINTPFIYNGRKAVISNGVHNTRFVYQDESIVWQTENVFTEASEESISNIHPFVDTLNNIWCIVNFTTFAKLYKRTPLGVWTSETITGCDKTIGEWDNTKLGTFTSDGKVHIAYFSSSNDLEYITNASGSWVNTHIDQEAYTTEFFYHIFQPQIALQSNGYPIILYPTATVTKLAIFNGATWSLLDFPITISYFAQMTHEAGRLYILADETRFIIYNISTGLVEKSDFVYPERRYLYNLFFPPIQNLEKTDFYIPINYASGKWLIYKRGTGTYQSQLPAPPTLLAGDDQPNGNNGWYLLNNWKQSTNFPVIAVGQVTKGYAYIKSFTGYLKMYLNFDQCYYSNSVEVNGAINEWIEFDFIGGPVFTPEHLEGNYVEIGIMSKHSGGTFYIGRTDGVEQWIADEIPRGYDSPSECDSMTQSANMSLGIYIYG